jgi:hypothetical protein
MTNLSFSRMVLPAFAWSLFLIRNSFTPIPWIILLGFGGQPCRKDYGKSGYAKPLLYLDAVNGAPAWHDWTKQDTMFILPGRVSFPAQSSAEVLCMNAMWSKFFFIHSLTQSRTNWSKIRPGRGKNTEKGWYGAAKSIITTLPFPRDSNICHKTSKCIGRQKIMASGTAH